jgi:hypothetical protein
MIFITLLLDFILSVLQIATLLYAVFETAKILYFFFKEEPEIPIIPDYKLFLIFIGWSSIITLIINRFLGII